MQPSVARRMWLATEPYHAVVYFAAEPRAAYDGAGLRGGWMGYFASRSAAMGPVPAAVVIATFFNFHPRMVRRAIPDAWGFAAPERVLAARRAGVDAALRRLLGDWCGGPEAVEAADLAHRAAEHCDPAGRPLHAAHADLDWPEEPHVSLWHALTLLREFRGDGHVTSLLAEGIDGCEAHITLSSNSGMPADVFRRARGWSEEEWAAAEDRLRARGWLRDDGIPTDAGHAVRDAVEARTDTLALAPWRHLGEEGCQRLADLLRPAVARITGGDGLPYPNPMGLPAASR